MGVLVTPALLLLLGHRCPLALHNSLRVLSALYSPREGKHERITLPSSQGAEEVLEVRIVILGHGGKGKTSMLKALLSGKGLAEEIHLDDRTVGIDVFRDWFPPGTKIKVSVSGRLRAVNSGRRG